LSDRSRGLIFFKRIIDLLYIYLIHIFFILYENFAQTYPSAFTLLKH